MASIRQPAVAGTFYPGDAAALKQAVRTFLDGADGDGAGPPSAIIAPHAGYVYSGAIAAGAYARLLPLRGTITRVVLMGPAHRVAFDGLAASSADAFATPLGRVPVDTEAVAAALALPQVQVLDAAHDQEHSLEVHLPFLQSVLEDFSLVPLVVGNATTKDVAEVMGLLWTAPETLLVVSSDLSHYQDYETARKMDTATSAAIEALDVTAIGYDDACGRVPVNGLLALARQRGLQVETVDLRNSGDTAGPRDHVVGYGAWVFT
jgi:AmmeMemoRadiSam system protein B